MTGTADLSVVMPTYKHAHVLPRALTALLTQSVRPREVIVVNDASPDDTPSVLDRFSNDPALRVIHNECNRGTNESVRIGVAAAQGKYLYCTASDDYVLPGFVEKMVGVLENHPQAGLSCAWFSLVSEATGEVRPNPSGWCDAPRYFTPVELAAFMGHYCIPGHTTVLKRSSFDAAGGFLSDLQWHSDWFLNFVVAFREGMCHVPDMVALLTESAGSYAAEGLRSEREVAAVNAIFNRLLSPDYADVAPWFARCGVLSIFGPPVLRAAVGRNDLWTKPLLTLLNCLTTEEYEALAENNNPAVRDLATFFLGRFWREVRERRLALRRRQTDLEQAAAGGLLDELRLTIRRHEQSLASAHEQLGRASETIDRQQAQLRELQAEAARMSQTVKRMEASYFWRARKLVARCAPPRLRNKPKLLVGAALRSCGRLFN